ncbi:hypothetical protein I4U23_003508 [Adineta vaga]|nr:hypothetical protein I4U23_003508 [Adineta vaga]
MQKNRPYNVLPVWHYDATKHRWRARDPAEVHYQKAHQQRSLRVITYNVWFDKRHQPLRFQHLNALLRHANANIICLQEMTRPILHSLVSQPWIQNRYVLSDVDGLTFIPGPDSYGVVMLIDKHLNLQQLISIPFPTKFGRQLLLAEIQIRSEIFAVGTVHLESMRRNEDTRSEQLQICQSAFHKYATSRSHATCLLVGDFNFDFLWPENIDQMNILKNWTDLWLKLNGHHNTGVTLRNVRFDRMMFQSSRVIPTGIRIIGDRPIGQAPRRQNLATNLLNLLSIGNLDEPMENVFISDHFGLMADFDLHRT